MSIANVIKTAFFLFFAIVNHPTLALDENQLHMGLDVELLNFMDSNGERAKISVSEKYDIVYQSFTENCNGTAIFILPGWSEPFIKYAETIYELVNKGFCVHIHDHRGQGLSSRLLSNPNIGHIENFEQYVSDFDQFFNLVTKSADYKKIFYLGHSMGGLIAISHYINYSSRADGLVLSAPMLRVNTGAWPEIAAYYTATGLDKLGFGEYYVFGHGDYIEKPFSDTRITTSRIRYEFNNKILRENPNLVVSGVSNRWLSTSMDYTYKMEEQWQSIHAPVLLLQAGDEHFVVNDAHNEFCKRIDQCGIVRFDQSRHEMLIEVDEIRNIVMQRILTFINNT